MSCHFEFEQAGGDAAETGAAAGAKGETHCKFDQLCSVNLFRLYRACVKLYLKDFVCKMRLLVVASTCSRIWMLVQIAVDFGVGFGVIVGSSSLCNSRTIEQTQ